MNAVSPTQAAALATTALSTDNPDAELLATITRFRAARAALQEEWDALNRLPKRHPEYKQRWAAFGASSDRDGHIEKWIARTAALTLAGAHAKAKLGYDMLAGDDAKDDDLLHDEGQGHCCMWSVALQGTRDMLRLAGQRCGSSWEEPDAEVLALCDEASATEDESELLGRATDDMFASDPRFDLLSDAARDAYQKFIGLAERAAKIPATTIAGMRAKAAIALRIPPRAVLDDHPVMELLLAEVAGIEPGRDEGGTMNAISAPEAGWPSVIAEEQAARSEAPHPDAALLDLCARLHDRAEEWQRLYDATSADPEACTPADDAFEAYSENVWPGFALQDEDNPDPDRDPVALLAILPAHTAEGRNARAVAVCAIDRAERYTEHQRDDFMQMVLLVVRDAAGGAAMKLGGQG